MVSCNKLRRPDVGPIAAARRGNRVDDVPTRQGAHSGSKPAQPVAAMLSAVVSNYSFRMSPRVTRGNSGESGEGARRRFTLPEA